MTARSAGASGAGDASVSAEPLTTHEVLREEMTRILAANPAGSEREIDELGATESLPALYRQLGSDRATAFSALCLSGGGIRSATFNLGVLQHLARVGVLGKFDYLSSVSGGGYIASWLRTWMFRAGTDRVLHELERPRAAPETPEPAAVGNLRKYSNYLTPRRGLFSGDTWAAAAMVLRNLLLNWLVIVPLFAALLGLPHLFELVVQARTPAAGLGAPLLLLALAVELAAATLVHWLRRFHGLRRRPPADAPPDTAPGVFVLLGALPICLAASLLSTAALFLPTRWMEDTSALWLFSAVWCVGIPIAGWAITEFIGAPLPVDQAADACAKAASASRLAERRPAPSRSCRRTLRSFEAVTLALSGAVAAALLVAVGHYVFPALRHHPRAYVITTLPTLLGIYLASRALFVGLASLSEGIRERHRPSASDDNDREWWGRMSGWVLLVMIGWIAVTSVCLVGKDLPAAITGSSLSPRQGLLAAILGALGGTSGVVAALLGSADTRSQANPPARPASRKRRLAQTATLLLFAVCLFALLAWSTQELGATLARALGGSLSPILVAGGLLTGLAALSFLAGGVVNVNRFSLHGLYRNRLVRAYLGASSAHRCADPFTGFSWSDNPRLHELWQTDPPFATRPLPIINTTLNVVAGRELAWQERKARSFSMTPFHCGSADLGYRPSKVYGGPSGISVGTAVTISGAAANPNMGYNSSPVLGLLMTLFNVRLGAWLGNPGAPGAETHRFSGPRHALLQLLAELIGRTSDGHPYVNLSDGGHFENLGLYEVIRRRCRRVVVCDAGHDGGDARSFAFGDLGNAIRKVRIDFGIRVVFDEITIQPNSATEPGVYCALGRIRYSAVDGTSEARDGELLYIKPTLRGAGDALPYDVASYARSHGAFPHESTADQWFSESQFESYRALGFHAIGQIARDKPALSIDDLFAQANGRVGNSPSPALAHRDLTFAPKGPRRPPTALRRRLGEPANQRRAKPIIPEQAGSGATAAACCGTGAPRPRRPCTSSQQQGASSVSRARVTD